MALSGFLTGGSSADFARALGGGGTTFGGINFDAILKQLSGGQATANAKNEQRYNDILSGLRGDKSKLLGDLQNFGQSQRNRITQDYQALTNSSLANLASRGLASSNLDTVTRSGVERQRQNAFLDLEDQLLGRRVDLERDINRDIYGVMERRTDQAADIGSILQMLQGYNQPHTYTRTYLPDPGRNSMFFPRRESTAPQPR